MRVQSLWLSLVLLLASAGAVAQEAAAELSAQFRREACWADSLGAMMIALSVRETGFQEARRTHVDDNPNKRAAAIATETLASLEKNQGLDTVSFTVNRHVACITQQVPSVTYSQAALGECFVHSAAIQRIAVMRDANISLDDALARVRAAPDGSGYRAKVADRESIVRAIFGQNPVKAIRYNYGEFMACLVGLRGTEGDPQAQTIAKTVWQQQCWGTGQLAFDVGDDWIRENNAAALTTRYNRDGQQAEAADMIGELGKTKFKNGAEYAATRYGRCMEAVPAEVRFQQEGPVASCYARIRPHRIVAGWRDAGRSKEDAHKALTATLAKGESQAGLAQAEKIIDWVYSGPAALNDYKLFTLFRVCAAQPAK